MRGFNADAIVSASLPETVFIGVYPPNPRESAYYSSLRSYRCEFPGAVATGTDSGAASYGPNASRSYSTSAWIA